ncbi:MAG: MBL fold metallo-hydrolase [Calditrichaeota bacterium]|nr:MAG: MBL fold metallo-hydrolase [Calditrichota bacterium]
MPVYQFIIFLFILIPLSLPLYAGDGSAVRLWLLETGRGTTREAFTIEGGSLIQTYHLIYGAVLVQHGRDAFLFDSGLGRQIDEQFDAEMPWWAAPLFRYEKGVSVFDQLKADSTLPRPNRIYLSHSHWDHASGLPDFPDLEVWVAREERNFILHSGPPRVFKSQTGLASTRWRFIPFEQKDFHGFHSSYDLYGDSSVVWVWMGGHTPGSVGMYVRAENGRRYFFPGDVVWNYDQITQNHEKAWLSRMLADEDPEQVRRMIDVMHQWLQQDPALQIVPAHDQRIWQKVKSDE